MLLGDSAAVKASVKAFGCYYGRREPMAEPVPKDKPLTLQIKPEQNLFTWKNEETGEVVEQVVVEGEYGWAFMKGAKDYVAAGSWRERSR